MSDSPQNQPPDSERIVRLERTTYWLKVGLIALAIAVAALVVPVLSFVFLLVAIGAGVVVVITAMICLLDRFFPGSKPGPQSQSAAQAEMQSEPWNKQ